jgi:hypothetical protein
MALAERLAKLEALTPRGQHCPNPGWVAKIRRDHDGAVEVLSMEEGCACGREHTKLLVQVSESVGAASGWGRQGEAPGQVDLFETGNRPRRRGRRCGRAASRGLRECSTKRAVRCNRARLSGG